MKNQINGSNDGKSKNAQQRKEIREKIDALRAEQNTFNNSRKAIQEHLKQVQDGIKLKVGRLHSII